MKKIVIIAHGLSDGGAERVASILANFCSRNGIDVTYICAYRNVNNVNREEYVLDENIKIKYIEVNERHHFLRFISRNQKILKVVTECSPDVVVSFINFDTLFTALSGVPIIYSLRNDPSHVRYSRFRTLIFDLEYAKARTIVFQTKGAQSYFGKKIQDKSVVIANPIITSELPRWNECEHRRVFVTSCRLNRQKNIPMLVDAFVKVHEQHTDYILEIYGEGELRESIANQIREKEAQSYIKLMGYSTDIYNIMTTSAGFVMSSDYEGLSNSMLEALCIGVPCICTDCPPGGAREYINSGENGFLIAVGDAEDMAMKICTIIESDNLSQLFSSNSMNYRKILDVNTICNNWLKLM